MQNKISIWNIKEIFVQLNIFLRRYSKKTSAKIALLVLSSIILLTLIAPLLNLPSPSKTGVGNSFESPSINHLMGTDNLGRDVLSGVIYGARISLFVGFICTLFSSIIAILIGAISGYYGGILDEILMNFTNIFMCIPSYALAIVFAALFGGNIWNIIFVISILSWPQLARVVRGEYLSIKESEFVEASKAVGLSGKKIIFSEILPNVLHIIIVNMSLLIPSLILMEAGLSFLGLGDPNVRSWGTMLNDAILHMDRAWWMAVFPGLAMFLTILTINIVSDRLNDILNPRLREAIHVAGSK